MIPPPAQEFMSQRAGSTVERIAGSHAIYVSQPQAVASLIKEAAKGTKAAAQTSIGTVASLTLFAPCESVTVRLARNSPAF